MTVRLNKRGLVSRWIVLFFCFFLIPVFTYSQNAVKMQNLLLSKLYFRNAVNEFTDNRNNAALRFVDVALSFYAEASDPHFLKAKILRIQKKYVLAENEVETALLNHDWNYYTDIEGRIFLAEIQYRLGDAGAAYVNLLPYKMFLVSKPDTAELFMKLDQVLGKNDDALAVARLFPREGFAQRILAAEDLQWRNEALARILQGTGADNYYTKEAVQELISHLSIKNCPVLLEYYKKRWGNDRFYVINSLCLDTTDITATLNALFTDGTVVSRNEVIRMKEILDLRKIDYSMQYFSSKSFTITDDLNNDGITDMVTVIGNGLLRNVKIDKNQDGTAEYTITFSKGTIQSVEIAKDFSLLTEYQPYPYVKTYIISQSGKTRDYTIVPYAIKLPLVIMPENPVLQPVMVNSYVHLPSVYMLEDKSSKFTEKDTSSRTVIDADRISSLDTLVTFLNSSGIVFKRRTYKGTAIQNQTEDINGDGVPDLFFTYHDGQCASMAFDQNNNGNPEYVEEYYPKNIKKWDFNDDGVFDFEEYTEGTTLVQEYSTKMNGTFDLRIEKSKNGTVKYNLDNKDIQ